MQACGRRPPFHPAKFPEQLFHVEVETFPCLVAGGWHHALDGHAAAKASHDEEELREPERVEPLLR